MECLFVLLRGQSSYDIIIPLVSGLKGTSVFFFHESAAVQKLAEHHTPKSILVCEEDFDAFKSIYSSLEGDIRNSRIILFCSTDFYPDNFLPKITSLPLGATAEDLAYTLGRNSFNNTWEDDLELLSAVVQKAPFAIFWKDRNFKFLGCNQSFCDNRRVADPSHIVGLSDFDLFPEEEAKRNREVDLEILKSGQPKINYEEQTIDYNGELDHYRKSKIPLKNKAGELIAILGIYERITERVKAQEHLASEQNYLRMLMDNLPDTIYFKDRESKFIRINSAQGKDMGISNTEEAIGKSDFDFFDQEHAARAFEDEQELMKNGVPVLNKLERVKTAQGYKFLSSSKIPLKDDSGKCIGMVGLSRDVTEEQLIRNEIKKEQELLMLLMDNIPDRIYFKDAKSRFIKVNKGHCLSNGIAHPNDIIGKTDFDLYDQETAEKKFELEKEILGTGIPMIGRLEKKYQNDGTPAWSSSTKVPIRNEKGEISGLVGISRDVTSQELARQELELAKQKAEEANKAKSMFLANMSHEIRTPMNGVIGAADILKRTQLEPMQHEYLDIIMKSGHTLLAIINDILDFSKIESGKLELERAPVNIRTVVEEVADVQAIQASEKGIDLITFVDPSIPEFVSSDSIRLKQVLTNLANNAVKFTEKGEVCVAAELVSTHQDEHDILFSVRDSGIGISAGDQQKLFQSFTQVDSSTTRKFGGTGLGLAICRRLVQIMGSDISLESQEGQGAVFSFRLKLKETEGKKKGFALRNISFKKLSALVVDDNKTNRLIFREYLESLGVKVYEAVNGTDALKKAQQLQKDQIALDFALLDFQMAGMDGLELAGRIRRMPGYEGLRLILASSVTDAVKQSDLEGSGCDFYLNKPVKLGKLYQGIATAMGITRKFESRQDAAELLKADLTDKRILIVEDNLINMKVAEHSLRNFCPNLSLAYNGEEAVELFKNESFDYILMDIQMPVMNGIDATRMIRELEMQKQTEQPVRIIAMTANTMNEDVEQCLQNGMDAFLGKPFNQEDLINAIAPNQKRRVTRSIAIAGRRKVDSKI